ARPVATAPAAAPATTAPAGATPAATSAPAAVQPKYGGVFRAASNEVAHVDPHLNANGALYIAAAGLAYSRLVKPTAGPERAGDSVLYAGDVAEKWDLADE